MASARTGHVEGSRVHGVKPLPELRHGLRRPENAQVQMKHGPTTSDRFLESEEGAARERAVRDDERGIRVADIEHGADRRIGQRSLAETRVPLGDGTIFGEAGEATLGHPAADLKAKL